MSRDLLSSKILNLFQQAYREKEFEAAEHLLQALEALAAKDEPYSNAARHRSLNKAYQKLVAELDRDLTVDSGSPMLRADSVQAGRLGLWQHPSGWRSWRHRRRQQRRE